MSKTRVSVFVVLLTAGVCVSPGGALAGQGRGHGRGHAHQTGKPEARTEAIAIDRDGHVRVIRDYGRRGSLPPGLAKRESLPPGLRKQLRERGQLPPGLEKRLVPVPAPLLVRLPAVPPYYQRYFVGDDLIVVDTRTNRIAAIIRNVWG
ncbi:MAG: hypothetical protein DMF86_16965 [Acidobacteria bacterium]|nr:MAG: hypothetical protein DMF86_16965 [Acidobacteriota bacterium]